MESEIECEVPQLVPQAINMSQITIFSPITKHTDNITLKSSPKRLTEPTSMPKPHLNQTSEHSKPKKGELKSTNHCQE